MRSVGAGLVGSRGGNYVWHGEFETYIELAVGNS